MHQPHPHRPVIPPVPEGVTRPLWSVMIPTYNCAEYLRQTLASVLAQDLGPKVMQITIVDDCSTQDDPAAVVEELGRGRVEFYRQPKNVGATKNFQTCLELARGKLIHQLHGDDYVHDGFYQKMQKAFSDYPEIGAAFCRNIFIDEHGNLQHYSDLELPESGVLPGKWLEQIVGVCRIQTPAIVVRREVYEKLGGFDHRFSLGGEDWEMWVRIAANYPMWYEVEPLAVYRLHSQSLTRRNVVNGVYIEQLYKAITVFQSYLPKTFPSKILKQAKRNCAFFALETADKLLAKGDIPKALSQIHTALRYSRSFRVIRSAARIILLYRTLWLLRTAVEMMLKINKFLRNLR
ncbi:glycosyltransferase [Brasilonema sp. UFV-L1]|uniref:glycosyltransferase family 2 protein n=1 Tax=Brasilonema sp. UFV-L1 TaxID=2234130 RepID=UPI00145F1DFA|nr:glycosyltransferase [Brasilonema sp. UFV-L1]NMG06417.1 family 2 glycosyl transferase [Brasilonema sp. UFV-L1]